MHTEHRDASGNPEATCNSRRCIHLPLLGIQYPPSTRNTCDIRSALRLPHPLKLRPDVSLRSVDKIYSCAIYCLLFPRLPSHVRYCLLSPAAADGKDADILATLTKKIYIGEKRRFFSLLFSNPTDQYFTSDSKIKANLD